MIIMASAPAVHPVDPAQAGIGDDQLRGVVRERKGADHTLAAANAGNAGATRSLKPHNRPGEPFVASALAAAESEKAAHIGRVGGQRLLGRRRQLD